MKEFKCMKLQMVGIIQVHVKDPQVDCKIQDGQVEGDATFVKEKIT